MLSGRVTTPARALSKWLGQAPSALYGLLFILLIPTYAALYLLVASDFYHSTSKYEGYLADEASLLTTLLEMDIRGWFSQRQAGPLRTCGQWTLEGDDISVKSVSYRDGDIHILTVERLRKTQDATDSGYWPIEVVINAPTEPAPVGVPVDASSHYEFFARLRDGYPDGPKEVPRVVASCLFGRAGQPAGVVSDDISLKVYADTVEHIYNWTRGLNGFPSGVTGSYWRMFYLSASTITTLGLGDIVPITNRARSLIATEAIAGLVLIGLFLNALVYEARQMRDEHKPLRE